MKSFIVYINGVEVKELLKAANHNAAEKKAQKKYGCTRNLHNPDGSVNRDNTKRNISVAYTEV